MPLSDIISESEAIITESEFRGLTLRLIGGIGVWHACPSAAEPPFKRGYKDIDVIGTGKELRAISDFFMERGYRANQRFNAQYGGRRLVFIDDANDRRVDVFLDRFEMAHKFDFRGRLLLCKPALPVSDLLMSKLQIVKMDENDVKDVLVIFLDHEIGTDPCRDIEIKYITAYTSSDWGIYRTFTDNLTRALQHLSTLSDYNDLKVTLDKKILAFASEMEKSPKTARWKIRSAIGTRKKWYEDVSDVLEQ
ncbi:MAG: hypothetical protein JRN10_07310 [Nitrososphaerota archaeon]|nr:hypothetical protein [Nitrososphaerota archaeon]MDG6931025.1 hypothetical protein [Nitrososphaerota archaeon]